MGKRGLVFYCILATPIAFCSYLVYKNYLEFKDFNPEKLVIDPETNQKYLTPSEVRKMGERAKSEKVPQSDQQSGYM
jgi:hypothetical protein